MSRFAIVGVLHSQRFDDDGDDNMDHAEIFIVSGVHVHEERGEMRHPGGVEEAVRRGT